MFSSILSRLSRVTVSQKFIPEIDGLRFLAISLVVLFHLRTTVLRSGGFDETLMNDDLIFAALSQSGLGVNLFFAISGFILAKPFLENRLFAGPTISLKRYFMRRLTRLEPPYIIIMTVLFIVIAAIIASFSELFPHYIASLFYVHMFVYGTWSLINPVAWSLETEVQFYILAPMISFIYGVRNTILRYVLYGIIVCGHLYLIQEYARPISDMHLAKSIVYYFSHFFIGFIAADLFMTFKWNSRSKSIISDLLAALSIVVIFYTYFNPLWYVNLAFCLAILVLFYAVFTGRISGAIFSNKTITTIGGMCYTIYLIHYVFLFICVEQVAKFASDSLTFYEFFSLCVVVLLPALLVTSSIVFYYLEKPFMYSDWLKRIRISF